MAHRYSRNLSLVANDQGFSSLEGKRPINCGWCICLTTFIVAIAVIVCAVLAAVSLSAAYAHYGTRVYTTSGELRNTPLGQTLDGNGGVLTMTLPDKTDFYDRTFVLADKSGAAHTLTLPAGVFFDGGFTTATFDGTVGSALVYRRVTQVRVHVLSQFGVALS